MVRHFFIIHKKYENWPIHLLSLPFLKAVNQTPSKHCRTLNSFCFYVIHGSVKMDQKSPCLYYLQITTCQYGKVLHPSNMHNTVGLWRGHIITSNIVIVDKICYITVTGLLYFIWFTESCRQIYAIFFPLAITNYKKIIKWLQNYLEQLLKSCSD